MYPMCRNLQKAGTCLKTQGCRGCHKLNGVGGSIGPDLTEEGANHRSPEWLERHFLAPNAVSAGSAMPNFHFNKDQARDLTYYMLSLTSEEMGTYFSSMRSIPGPAYGRQLFVEKNCISCHAVGGVGTKTGPDLLGVTKRHSLEWLDEQLVNPELVYPGSAMPEYDLETNARKALVAFMAAATPADAQSILSGKPRAQSPDEISPSKQANRTFPALDASVVTERNCRAAWPTQTRRAAKCLRFSTSPTTTPKTKLSQSSAMAECLPWITRQAPHHRCTCPRGNMC